MLKAERQKAMVLRLNNDQKLNTNQLSVLLDVSKDTVRRDLKELNAKGKIQKVYGGAVPISNKNTHFFDAIIINEEKKYAIAKKAISLLDNNQVIIISGGTTNLVFAKLIPIDIKLTIYTYSLPIAVQLSKHPNIELIFIGGKLQKNAMVTIGLDVIQFLSNIKVDICFLGVSSISNDNGLTETGYEVSVVKKAMIQASNKVITMVTSEKLDTKKPHVVCELSQINTIITDLKPKDARFETYKRAGVIVI